MKTLNITFTDAEFRRLLRAKQMQKKGISWHEFILKSCARGVSFYK